MAFDTLRLFQNADQIEGFLTKRLALASSLACYLSGYINVEGLPSNTLKHSHKNHKKELHWLKLGSA
uniref:Uncharacterized protein n=1 Tax=Solanum lycopersicum TaxID=4081 RepID=A0A3Q7H8R3_SOLLC